MAWFGNKEYGSPIPSESEIKEHQIISAFDQAFDRLLTTKEDYEAQGITGQALVDRMEADKARFEEALNALGN